MSDLGGQLADLGRVVVMSTVVLEGEQEVLVGRRIAVEPFVE